MGLLDVLNSDQARLGLSLLAAAGPSPVPQSFGQRLIGGLLQSDEMKRQQEQALQAKQFREMQMQQMALQYQQALKAQQQADLDRTLTQQAFKPVQPIEANQASGVVGPRPGALGVVGQMPTFNLAQAIGAGMSPERAMALEQSFRKDNTPLKLGAGETLYDPRTFKPLASNPKEDSTPSAVKEYQFAVSQGYPGTYQQFVLEQKRAGATNVKVDTGPKAFDTDLGKLGVDILKTGREGAQAAAGTLESINQIRQATSGGAFQGTGADLKLGAAKALGALGMPYDAKTVANTELFSAQANQFVLNSIKGLGANPSNADREFIEKTVPRLQTDPSALPALLNFLEGKAKRQIGGYNQQARAAQKSSPFLPFSLEVQEPATNGGWSIKPKGQ